MTTLTNKFKLGLAGLFLAGSLNGCRDDNIKEKLPETKTQQADTIKVELNKELHEQDSLIIHNYLWKGLMNLENKADSIKKEFENTPFAKEAEKFWKRYNVIDDSLWHKYRAIDDDLWDRYQAIDDSLWTIYNKSKDQDKTKAQEKWIAGKDKAQEKWIAGKDKAQEKWIAGKDKAQEKWIEKNDELNNFIIKNSPEFAKLMEQTIPKVRKEYWNFKENYSKNSQKYHELYKHLLNKQNREK